MGNGQHGGKSPASSATQVELGHKIHEAFSKALDNEKRIQELEKTVNDKSQWNNTVRGWIGKRVRVRLLTNGEITGDLKGLDRYTLLVFGTYTSSVTDIPNDVIIHKGAIATIELA